MLAKRRSLLYTFSRISVVVIVVVILGVAWLYEYPSPFVTVHRPQTIMNSGVNAMPTTEKPALSEFDKYQVAPALPRYLFIPKIAVKAMVKPMGVTAKNQIEAPGSAFDAGWYDKSAKPGESGALLIDGHVSGGTVPGIFYNLKNLMPGDELTIERGDGLKLVYEVVKSQTYDVANVDMKAVLAPINSTKPGVNLITCTGSVIRGTNNYDKRVVVFTQQAEN